MSTSAGMWIIDDSEPSYEVHEIVVTDTRIAMSWTEDSGTFHAKLESNDGRSYVGTYRFKSLHDTEVRNMELTRVLLDGETFLFGRFEEDHCAGPLMIKLRPEPKTTVRRLSTRQELDSKAAKGTRKG